MHSWSTSGRLKNELLHTVLQTQPAYLGKLCKLLFVLLIQYFDGNLLDIVLQASENLH